MSITLSVDFETRSLVNLRKSGVYRYAEDPSTEILCMAFAFGDEDVSALVRDATSGRLVGAKRDLRRIIRHVEAGLPLRAHNAQFERLIWREILGPRYGFPVPALEQWYCTAAEAAALALPRALENAALVLNVPVQKDMAGRRLMLQMSKPRKVKSDGTVTWWDDPERMARLVEYCKTDVATERAVAKRIRRLSKRERAIYLLDQRINDRGIRLDVRLIEAAQEVVRVGTEAANRKLAALTDGAVAGVTKVADLTAWLQAQGVEISDVRRSTVRDLLADPDTLDLAVQQVLLLRQEAGKSSTSKLTAMERVVSADGRARGLLLYHGASTGRWAGRLIQPQNFPRGEVKDVTAYIPLILEGYDTSTWADPPLAVVSTLLRSMLIASPGCRLMSGDYSQIEARIVGWFAGEPYGHLEYEKMAAAIFRVPLEEVTPDQRQVGKNTVLGCGFQMGPSKFRDQFVDQTGLEMSEDLAERAVRTFRTTKPGIPRFWYDIQSAAIRAVQRPGDVTTAGVGGQVQYTYRGQFLWCVLPSGRLLAYALPRVEEKMTKYGPRPQLTFMGVNAHNRKWQRIGTYGGHLTENVVQATARDVMAEAMLRLEAAGYPLVLTVHDEVVADVPKDHGSLDHFLTLLRKPPTWLQGCNLEVEGWEGERYRK